MIKLENISKTYNVGTNYATNVFQNFNLEIKEKEFVSIIGPNGCGKSTLFNIISGNIEIDCGKIFLKDKDITKVKNYKRYKYIGRVHQNPSIGTCLKPTQVNNPLKYLLCSGSSFITSITFLSANLKSPVSSGIFISDIPFNNL